MYKFQSYLVLGQSKQSRRRESKKIAKELSLYSINKPSPDISIVSSVKNSIKIDQIRDVKSYIFKKPVSEKFRLVIVESAHKLTTQAQNAFLKLLEEPPSHAIIILEAKNKRGFLPTILSRIITVNSKKTEEDSEPKIMDGLKSLEIIPQIEDPEEFIDSQMVSLANLLAQKAAGKKVRFSNHDLVDAIEKCKETKKLILSNINPTFALTSLIFNLNLNKRSI